MTLIGYIFIGVFALYAAFMLYFLLGLIRLRKTPKIENSKEPTVSVIVAVRNEEENLKDLLEDLSRQTYPQEKLQIIIANDRSTDNSWAIIGDYINKYNNFIGVKISKLSKTMTPKNMHLLKQSKNQMGK